MVAVGASPGFLARISFGEVLKCAANDTRVAVVLLVAAVLLVVTGLLLERAGVDPNRERREREDAPDQPA